MDLLERYLQAVKFWLPKDQKRDLIAELAEDLRSQIEDKENELGRKLAEPELEAILKQKGSPVVVANRYLPQQSLIGPLLFPIYVLVLKIVALCYFVPWVLVWIGFLALAPSYRTHSPMFYVVRDWGNLWVGVLTAFAVITIVFAVLERTQQKTHFLEKWEPRKLPRVRHTDRIARSSSIVELVLGLIFCSWLVDVLRTGPVFDRYDVRIVPTYAGRAACWAFLASVVVGLGLSFFNLLQPYWTRKRALVRACMNFGSAIVLLFLFRSSLLLEISGASIPPAEAAEVTKGFNLAASGILLAIALCCIIAGIVEIFRINRLREESAWLPQRTSNA